MPAELEELERRLGHTFRDRDLLLRALTHKSRRNDPPPKQAVVHDDNEPLEFLGDAVLGFLSSDLLYKRCPGVTEGHLSRLKAHYVSAAHLHEVARELDLGSFLRLGRGEEQSGGRAKKMLLANALEALIAALYLDGGLEACRVLIERYVLPDRGETGDWPPEDAKGALQFFAQSNNLLPPRYSVVREHGPGHARTFTVEVRVGDSVLEQAEGSSKKAATRQAAERALERLRVQMPGAVPAED